MKKATGKRTAPRRKTSTAKTSARKKGAKSSAPRGAAAVAVRGTLATAAARVARRTTRRHADLDAIELLERDHRRFEALLEEGEKTTERATATRRRILKTMAEELTRHEAMEEKVLYPALQSHPQARDIVLEGYEEHHVADVILRELQQSRVTSEQWGAKFKVLKESLEHHIEEEEGEMFRKARGIFSRDELQELAVRMKDVTKAGRKRTRR